jgi:DnaJ-class molecular chaperone
VLVECTIREMYNGCMKTVSFTRGELHHDAKTPHKFPRTKSVEIKPGFSEETVLVFAEEGNAQYNFKSSDLVIKFRQIEDPHFRRIGNDLILTTQISLEDALRQKPVTFRTLDDRCITYTLDEQISPQTCKLIPNEGMPMTQEPEFQFFAEKQLLPFDRIPRGSLYLRFDIIFPKSFATEPK